MQWLAWSVTGSHLQKLLNKIWDCRKVQERFGLLDVKMTSVIFCVRYEEATLGWLEVKSALWVAPLRWPQSVALYWSLNMKIRRWCDAFRVVVWYWCTTQQGGILALPRSWILVYWEHSIDLSVCCPLPCYEAGEIKRNVKSLLKGGWCNFWPSPRHGLGTTANVFLYWFLFDGQAKAVTSKDDSSGHKVLQASNWQKVRIS